MLHSMKKLFYVAVSNLFLLLLLIIHLSSCSSASTSSHDKTKEIYIKIPLRHEKEICVNKSVIQDKHVIKDGILPFLSGLAISNIDVRTAKGMEKWGINGVNISGGIVYRDQEKSFKEQVISKLQKISSNTGIYKIYFAQSYNPRVTKLRSFPIFTTITSEGLKHNIELVASSHEWFYIAYDKLLNKIEFVSVCRDDVNDQLCTGYLIHPTYFGKYLFNHRNVNNWKIFQEEMKNYLLSSIREC